MIKKLVIILASSVLLSSCAVMNEDECRAANWQEVGYNDGTIGLSSNQLAKYVKACSEYVNVDTAQYNDGRRQGADVFCSDNNAFSLGTQGKAVSDICDVSNNQRNFSIFYTRGMNVYYAKNQLDALDEKIRSYDLYLNQSYLFSLTSQLQANQVYLANLRTNLVKYVEYVNRYAFEKDIERQDYAQAINNVPYPRVAETADSVQVLVKERDNAIIDIHRRYDDDRRCMDEARGGKDKKADNRRYDACNAHAECLRREEFHLNQDVDRIIRSIRGDEGRINYNVNEYKNCR